MRAQLSFVLSQITPLTDRQTERRTDKQTEFSSLDRVCIPCSAVKSSITTFLQTCHKSLTTLKFDVSSLTM